MLVLRKQKSLAMLGLTILLFVLVSAHSNNETPEQKVALYFSKQLDSLENTLLKYQQVSDTASPVVLEVQFKNARIYYKRVEFLIEYFYASAAVRMNGPALLEADAAEPEEPQHPTGFQVLEEAVYEEPTLESKAIIKGEISNLLNRVRRVQGYNKDLELDASIVFDALKLNIYRLLAKGISGFDSPVSFNSLQEAAATLESMNEVLSYYNTPTTLLSKCDAAIQYAKQPVSFNDFDRAKFITSYINPLLAGMHDFQIKNGIAFSTADRALQTNTKDFFQQGVFNMYYFAPTGTEPASAEVITLGKKLFNDPLLSSNGKRSCSSCHIAGKAFTDGLALNASIFGDKQLLRNTPTLINASLQPVQFYDSRIAFLEDQVHDVISNQQEMGGELSAVVDALKKKKEYKPLFTAAYGKTDVVTKTNIKKALAAYVRSLTSLNARFDNYMRGDETAMTVEEIHGFNLFMGKAKCGTCHYVPLFNGTVPPLYDKVESEVLGVPATADTLHAVLDADSGKYHLYKMPHQVRSFKTPGLRNIAYTAPYMHNGVFKTLEEVIDFYNRGGGEGLKLDVPNQTLPPDNLDLSVKEKKAIIAFLHSLSDTTNTL